MSRYEGPHRYVNVSVSETDNGLLVSVHEFEIHKGRRTWKRAWPPVLLTMSDRPRSIPQLLRRVGSELDPGAGP